MYEGALRRDEYYFQGLLKFDRLVRERYEPPNFPDRWDSHLIHLIK